MTPAGVSWHQVRSYKRWKKIYIIFLNARSLFKWLVLTKINFNLIKPLWENILTSILTKKNIEVMDFVVASAQFWTLSCPALGRISRSICRSISKMCTNICSIQWYIIRPELILLGGVTEPKPNGRLSKNDSKKNENRPKRAFLARFMTG